MSLTREGVGSRDLSEQRFSLRTNGGVGEYNRGFSGLLLRTIFRRKSDAEPPLVRREEKLNFYGS